MSATPEMIARFGHIAVLMRRYLETTGMSKTDFAHHVMRKPRNYTTHYHWINGSGAPNQGTREYLHKVMGVPVDYMVKRDPDAPADQYPPEPTKLKVPASWKSSAEPASSSKELVTIPVTKVMGRPAKSNGRRPVLAFHLWDDDTASVHLMADDLPGEEGKNLLRKLLEIGLTQRSP